MMIPKKEFGRTGHMSSRTIFGAVALASVSQDEANETIEMLLERGVNHIDVARSYGDAEIKLAPGLQQYRDEFFLATKTERRTYDGAWRELEESLERMGVDGVDLWQMHFLIGDKEWKTAMGPDGALKAFIEAREQGIVRYLGVTGHELIVPRTHLRSLKRFDFDAVLLPYNYPLYKNPAYAADFEALAAMCEERNVAVQTIKSLAKGRWPDEAEHTHAVWYEPITEQAAIDRAVHWVLGDPRVFLNTSGDVELLVKTLDAAERFEARPSDEEMDALVEQYDMEPLFT
jgi:predicted aldo/keto reductase-like oxidoreductase